MRLALALVFSLASARAVAQTRLEGEEIRRQVRNAATAQCGSLWVEEARKLGTAEDQLALSLVGLLWREVAAGGCFSQCATSVSDDIGSLGPKAVPVLVEALGRAEDCGLLERAIGIIGPEAVAPVTRVLAAGEEPATRRAAAASALAHIINGRDAALAIPALPGLRRALSSADTGLLNAAITLVRDMGPTARPIVPALVPVLRHTDEQVRGYAAGVLAELDVTPVIERLEVELQQSARTGGVCCDVAMVYGLRGLDDVAPKADEELILGLLARIAESERANAATKTAASLVKRSRELKQRSPQR